MIERLKYIAKCEKISITDEAISEIAHYANGGLRDAIGMLDKLRSFTNDKITVDIFKNINGMISQEEINKFYDDILNNDINGVLSMIDKVNEEGYDFKNFVERLMILARDKIVNHYTKKENIEKSVEYNVNLVSVLNDILNRLKEAIEPIVIVQIYILKFMDSEQIVNKSEPKIISQEIKLPEKEQKNETVNAPKEEKKPKNTINIVVNEENKKIRINNAMATADIRYKKELTDIWKELDKYFMDSKFGKVAQLLSDTVPMVVGSEYLILTAASIGIIDNLYGNLSNVEKLLAKIYHKISVVILLDDEFNEVKNKYIEDRKNNVIYEIIKEKGKLVEEKNDLINQAINVFGTDLVDIEEER